MEQFANPQVDDWKPEDAAIEAEHLAEDAIILFPVTGETLGMGSLSEVGFSILNAIKLDSQRDFVVLIESDIDPALREACIPREVKDSVRARALVKQHLKKLRLSNLYVVDTMEQMREVALELYKAAKVRIPLQRFNPHAEPKL